MHGVVPPQVQDPALALVELHQVPLRPTLQFRIKYFWGANISGD